MRPDKFFFAILAMAAPAAAATELVKVTTDQVERTLRLPGEFQPYLSVALHARVTGFVESVEVDRGSAVRKGQPLVTLSAPEMAAQLAEAQAKVQGVEAQRAEAAAKLAAAEGTYQRLKTASETPGVVAGNELILAKQAADAARALVDAFASSATAARAAVDALRELESYLQVSAPFDGVVTERHVHPGALVGPGAGGPSVPLLSIEQNSRLRLVVAVPETDVPGIVRGARVPFTVSAHPGRTFHGTVARIPRSVDPKTRSMGVELDVANAQGMLAPGMYAEVRWPVRRRRSSMLVPPTSIVTTTERTFVIRAKDGVAEWVDVTRAGPAGEMVEVFGDLSAGDEIVRRASDEIRQGSPLH